MNQDQYNAFVAEHGGTYAAWESVGVMVDEYRAANPDDDHDLYELIQAGVFGPVLQMEPRT